MQHTVIIVSSSYGADYIKEIGGQYHIVSVVKAAGADGIEIRRELFSDAELTQLPLLAKQIADNGLQCFYSVPFHLFIENGMLNPRLNDFLDEAKQLNAKLLKFSLGYFKSDTDLSELKQIITQYDIQLVVENDQTECGIIEPFEQFFAQVNRQSVPVKMTFDTGNWLCLDIDPMQAAKRLAQHVGYIHIKASKIIQKGKIDALPPVSCDSWMHLINDCLPNTAFRGIEFALMGTCLETVSKKYVELLRD